MDDSIHPMTEHGGVLPASRSSEVAHPNERSVHVCKAKGKWKLITRKPSKSDLRNRVPITDIRRTYSQLLLGAISSCDSSQVVDVFTQYCTPDMMSLALYTGPTGNPRGTNIMEIRSRDNHISFLCQYFTSVPDLVMKSEFLCAYTDKAAKMSVVKCKYRMSGTRIIDIKIENNVQKIAEAKEQSDVGRSAQPPATQPVPASPAEPQIDNGGVAAEGVLSEKGVLFEKSELFMDDDFSLFSFDCDATDGLLDADWNGAPPTSGDTSDPHATSFVPPGEPAPKKQRRAKVKQPAKGKAGLNSTADTAPPSLYAVGQSVKVPDGSRTYLDSVPLLQSASLNYRGTYTVYLDENSKIFRYEFIYTIIE